MNNDSYLALKKTLQDKNKEIKSALIEKHKDAFDWINNTKQLAAGAMGGLLLLASPGGHLLAPPADVNHEKVVEISRSSFLIGDLGKNLPSSVGQLSEYQEEEIAKTLSQNFGISVKSQINNLRLNTTYGYIGLEQNLMRYPGDVVSNMAPGRGAFGYFVNSKAELDEKAIEKEKYYIAVQTFMAKDYNLRVSEYRDFFRFRKMLVVNPSNGKALVVVIGDAGPAVWTGKHLGGSPEVMSYLERVDGKARGGVLYFFIEDPEDKVLLGPIEPV